MNPIFKQFLTFTMMMMCSFTLLACGTTEDGSKSQKEGESGMNNNGNESQNLESEDNNNNGIVAGAIVPSATVTGSNNNITVAYQLKNQTEKVKEFVFNTSQKFDYILAREDGTIISQYSEGKMFLQAITYLTLKQGESYEIPVRLTNLEEGNYILTIWLTTKSMEDYKIQVPFAVPFE
jgi:hypothetical protein